MSQLQIQVPPIKTSEIPQYDPKLHFTKEPRVLAVGDSILKGCAYLLEPRGWKIDAEEGRWTKDGLDSLAHLLQQYPWVPKVYIHLGTNGGINDRDVNEILDQCEFRHVGLCTIKVNRLYRFPANRMLRRRARNGEFSLHDWCYRARNKPEWFYKEGKDLYHPKPPAGTKAYAAGALTCMGEKHVQ